MKSFQIYFPIQSIFLLFILLNKSVSFPSQFQQLISEAYLECLGTHTSITSNHKQYCDHGRQLIEEWYSEDYFEEETPFPMKVMGQSMNEPKRYLYVLILNKFHILTMRQILTLEITSKCPQVLFFFFPFHLK